MYSVPGDTTSLVPGFPIRTSSDPRSVDSSPRHIAASHVLHRLPVPRHPPCALKHLQTQKPIQKEIAHQHPKTTPDPKADGTICVLDARNHYPQIKHHTPPPKQGDNHTHPNRSPSHPRKGTGLLSHSPIVCSVIPPAASPRPTRPLLHQNRRHYSAQPIHRIAQNTAPLRSAGQLLSLVVLLRKEVIQPHLPVRLPCYDFVPIADPTFDRSLPNGLGHGLRVLPTFMT